ncbi:MAG: ferrous iron transport protein A [Planctomycetes bacterium]|nr:ferrous iron transport protein A [Planctomycetota bacterium]
MRLSECAPGQGGRIAKVEGDDAIGQRLMEMGLIEGVDVKVVRIAPLGDPIEIEVQHYKLSLRKSEAQRVELAP